MTRAELAGQLAMSFHFVAHHKNEAIMTLARRQKRGAGHAVFGQHLSKQRVQKPSGLYYGQCAQWIVKGSNFI